MQTRIIEITSTDGIILEGQLDLPDGGDAAASHAVVICHPHPLYGGEMTNAVVMAISAAVVGRGLTALRFNFRGAGRSTGAYADGIGEADDVEAALAWLALGTFAGSPGDEARPGVRVALAGYSFGGGVALTAASRRQDVAALALVSPAINENAGDTLNAMTMPKFIATGEADNFATVERVRGLASSMGGSTELYISPQADHFWWGEEAALGNRVADFIASAFARGEG